MLIDIEGTVDELNSFLGLAMEFSRWNDIKSDLDRIQNNIFTLGEHVLTESNGRKLSEDDVTWLEDRVNFYRKEIGKIVLFVIPGGSKESSALHVARTVSRRLERLLVLYAHEKKQPDVVMKYANRVSSLLFMLALASNKRQGIEERIWPLRPGQNS
jgi:ATP:cob(I)alamin adenosyltransferase